MTAPRGPNDERLLRVLTGGLFGAAMLLSSQIGSTPEPRLYTFILGLGLPVGLAWLWRKGSRPKNNAVWWILGLLAMGTLIATGFVVLAASLAVGFFLTHDMRLTPSLMFTGCALAVIVVPGLDWTGDAGDQEAWFVAMAMYLGLMAAMIERDRLAARDGPPIPWLWNGVRAGLVGLWTVLVLVYRETLEAGRVFAWFGADPTGFEGQFLLVAILVAAVLLAALAFRAGRPRQPAPQG